MRHLLGPDGNFKPGFVRLMRQTRRRAICRLIEREFRAQIEHVLAAGVDIDHLNSHQHVHMIPAIFRIVCRLAVDYRVPCVRMARELPHRAGNLRQRLSPLFNSNSVKHSLLNALARWNEATARTCGVHTTDYFVGVNYTSRMDLATIQGGLAASPSGSVEVLLHPALGPDPRDVRYPHRGLVRYVSAPQRRGELAALGLRELSDFLEHEHWQRIDFARLADLMNSTRPPERTPAIPASVHELCAAVRVPAPPWVSAAQEDSRAFAELVAVETAPGRRVLDLGTGSGIIAICLARLGRQVSAADLSGEALRAAQRNASACGVEFACFRSDLLAGVPGRFDVIAFNPPYNFRPDTFATNVAKNLVRRVPVVRRGSGLAMPRPVLRFHQQLIERLMRQAPEHLAPGGRVILHAYESEVAALLSALPPQPKVELLRHAGLINQTVGLVIQPEVALGS
jgi:methylase of polypeptide subunit release factors